MTATTKFDAAAWLRNFKAAGGTFSSLPDGEWIIGWRLDGQLDDDNARALFNEVRNHPNRLAAIKIAVEPERTH